jgi:outer membrane protein
MNNLSIKTLITLPIIIGVFQWASAADDLEATNTEAVDSKVSIEFTYDESIKDENGDPEVAVQVRKNGKRLEDEELEEWETEVMEGLENVFKGTPRKGIFALQQDRDSGFLELGFGLKSSDSLEMMREGFEGLEFATEFNVGVQLSGLFYEYFSDSGNRGVFGVNFYNNDWIGLDLIGGLEHDKFADDKEDTLLLPIDVRHADFTGGFRSTVYLGPLVVQGQVRKEITKYHQGYTGSLQAGTNVQIRNLNIHAVAGASYQSAEVMDYYYGVTSSEVSPNFAEYKAGEDIRYNAEIGASYPLGESWVLRGKVDYTQYSDSMINSPFWESDSNEHISSALMLMLVL